MNLTIAKYLEGIKNKLFTPKEVILDYQKRAKSLNPELNACVRFNDEYATTHAEDFAQKPLAALPIMVKDNILIKGELATCSSKMLENYQAPYTATCMEKLEKAGALMIGQTNMDEFAMEALRKLLVMGRLSILTVKTAFLEEVVGVLR